MEKILTISPFGRFLPFHFLVQFLVLLVSFSITASSSTLEWNSDTSYPFIVYSTVALTGQDLCIYVFGGHNISDTISLSYRFNTTAGAPREWTPIASMPNAGTGTAGCVANDGRFFIFGGGISVIQIYNATDNSWNTTSPLPSGTSIEDYYMSCAVDKSTGLMYLTGGETNGKRFFSYDTGSNTITNVGTSAFNVFAHGSFVIDSKLYVFGGVNSTGSSIASTYIYDISSEIWIVGATMSYATAYFGYATDDNRFYVIGGEDQSELLNHTQVYNILSNTWSVDDGIVYPGGLFSNAAAFSYGSLHTIGSHLSSMHQIASLCGVYTFNGSCDNLDQCIINGTCQENGLCTGTCISFSGCNCTSTTSSSSTSTSISSSTSSTASSSSSTSISSSISTSNSPVSSSTTSTSISSTESTSTTINSSSTVSIPSIALKKLLMIAFIIFQFIEWNL